MRIERHPILDFPSKPKITFYFNDKEMVGYQGDTIASALHDLGILELTKSIKNKRSRGFYCAIGNCGSCHMTVNGIPNTKTCITKLEAGMRVYSQDGLGVIQ